MAENFHDHVIHYLLSLTFPSINTMNYYVYEVVKKHSHKHPQKLLHLQDSCLYLIVDVPNKHLIIACSWFRQRVENIIAADSGFSEWCRKLCKWSPVENVKI